MNYRPASSIDPIETMEVTNDLWMRCHRLGHLPIAVVDQPEAQTERNPNRFYIEKDGALFRVDVTPTDRVSVQGGPT